MKQHLTKNIYLNYILVSIIIIYSAKSLSFFFSAISIFIPILISAAIYFNRNHRLFFTEKSKKIFVGSVILMLLYIIKFNTIDPLFITYHLGLILISFFAISLIGKLISPGMFLANRVFIIISLGWPSSTIPIFFAS